MSFVKICRDFKFQFRAILRLLNLNSALSYSIATIIIIQLYKGFRPFYDWVQPFNSDDGIAVIMSRDGMWSPFCLYYYGQDRLGSWFYIIAGYFARLVGEVPSAIHIYDFAFCWMVFGITRLFKNIDKQVSIGLAVFGFLLMVSRQIVIVKYIFNMSQPYMVQMGGMAAIISLMVSDTSSKTGPTDLDPNARPKLQIDRIRNIIRFCIHLTLTFLIVWLNRASSIFMGAALATIVAYRWRPAVLIRWSTLIALASFFECFLRHMHKTFAVAKFGTPYAFVPELDLENIKLNTITTLRLFANNNEVIFMLTLVSIWLAINIGSCILSRWREIFSKIEIKNSQFSNSLVTVVGLSAVLFAQLALLVVTDWMRINHYHPRYLSPCFCILVLITSLVIVDWARTFRSCVFRNSINLKKWYSTIVVSLICVASFILFPKSQPNEADLLRIMDAKAMSKHFPNTPLLGQYWETHVYAGLQKYNPVISIASESDYNRMPWNVNALKSATLVLVSHDVASRFGGSENPLPAFEEFGFKFGLVRPHALPIDELNHIAPISLYQIIR